MIEVYKKRVGLKELDSELLRSAWKFWVEARGEARLPPVSAINPRRMPRALIPNISVIAIEDGPKRFLIRLVGNAVTTATGQNLAGRYAEDIKGGERTVQRFEACLASREPYYYEGNLTFAVHDFRLYKALVMPFGDEDGTVRRLFVVSDFPDMAKPISV
jgi:hypothetical protein